MCLSCLMGCGDCVFDVLRCGVAPRFDSMVWHLFAAFFPGGFCEITFFFEVLAGRGGLWQQEGVACLHRFYSTITNGNLGTSFHSLT